MESVVHQPTSSHYGGGAVGEKIRQHPWGSTSLGHPEHWPINLQTSLRILLTMHDPGLLLWGNELVSFYNNSFAAAIASKPEMLEAFGKPGLAVWLQNWSSLLPLVHQVRQNNESISVKDYIPLLNNGKQRGDKHWQVSLTPIPDEKGATVGVFITCSPIKNEVDPTYMPGNQAVDFYKLILQIPVPIAVFRGPDFTGSIANQAYLQLTGRREEEFIGKPITASLPALKNEIEQHALKMMQAGDGFIAKEFSLSVNQDGGEGTHYYNFFVEPLHEDEGNVTGLLLFGIDVTEQAKARKQIEDSEQRFQNLIREASVGIIVLKGSDMKAIVVNEAYAKLIGRHAEDILNQDLFSIIPEAEESFRPLLENVRSTGEPFYLYDHPYQVFSGNKKIEGFLNVVYQPYREVDGTITGVMVLCQDVTEQVQARKNTKETEERMRIAVEAAELGTVEVNLITDETTSSPRFDKIFDVGNTSERSRYIEAFHPDDLPVRSKAYEKAFKDGQLEYEARIIRKDNTQRWIRAKGRIFFDEAKKPIRLFGAVQDITEEKEFANEMARQVKERTAELEFSRREIERSANRLNSVFNSTQSGMFIFTPVKNDSGELVDFRFVITNPAFAAYVGQTPDVLDGELGSKWFPGYLHNGVFEMYKKTYLTGETLRQDIHYNVDGLDIYLDLMSSKVGHEVLVTFTDYTPLKIAQLQLEKLVEDLKRSNANLEEFAYAASHDLKEPIRKVHVFSDRLKSNLKGRMNAEEEHFFERMQIATKRMNLLIDDLLNYSQLNIQPNVDSEIDLNDLLRIVISDLDLEIEEKKAVIKVATLPTVKGHHRQLQQAFQNLLSNALKYSRHNILPSISITSGKMKGSELNLSLSPTEMHESFHVITVKDNGIGFHQDDAEKIFNVFTRLHGNTDFRGTGVGLSIVRKVMENHKGYVTAEGNPEEGARFTLIFPF